MNQVLITSLVFTTLISSFKYAKVTGNEICDCSFAGKWMDTYNNYIDISHANSESKHFNVLNLDKTHWYQADLYLNQSNQDACNEEDKKMGMKCCHQISLLVTGKQFVGYSTRCEYINWPRVSEMWIRRQIYEEEIKDVTEKPAMKPTENNSKGKPSYTTAEPISNTPTPTSKATPSRTSTQAPQNHVPSNSPSTPAPSSEAPSTKAPSTEAPSTEAPSTEAPSTEAPSTEAPTEAPAEAQTKAPTEAPTEAQSKAPTEAPAEAQTKAPTETSAEAPTEAPTEAPSTEAPSTPMSQNSQNFNSNTTKNNTSSPTSTPKRPKWPKAPSNGTTTQSPSKPPSTNSPAPSPVPTESQISRSSSNSDASDVSESPSTKTPSPGPISTSSSISGSKDTSTTTPKPTRTSTPSPTSSTDILKITLSRFQNRLKEAFKITESQMKYLISSAYPNTSCRESTQLTCNVSNWSSWSNCSEMYAVQSRFRSLISDDRNSSSCESILSEERFCSVCTAQAQQSLGLSLNATKILLSSSS